MVVSVKRTVVDLIGNTPMVELKRLNPNKNVKVFLKLESFNPGGSIKDRIAKAMLEGAEARGELTHNKTIIEPTSGNTGIGLAMVAAAKGYSIEIVMSEGASVERQKILNALGAKLILTPADRGTDGAIEKVKELLETHGDKYFHPNQFDNPDNARAHYETTAEEIWRDTNGKITHFVAGVGTSGTIMGCSKKLKELNPKIKIIGVQPKLGTTIAGLKNMDEQIRPSIFKRSLIDEVIELEPNEGYEATRQLARKEGILAGMSAGAALTVALEKAKKLKEGTVVIIIPDGGEKYLSTALFECGKGGN